MLEGWRDGISLLSSRYYENGKCVMEYTKPEYGYPGWVRIRLDPPKTIVGSASNKEDALKIYNIFKNTNDIDAAYATVKVMFKLRGSNRNGISSD